MIGEIEVENEKREVIYGEQKRGDMVVVTRIQAKGPRMLKISVLP